MTTLQKKYAVTAITALSIVGTLAGCANATTTGSTTTDSGAVATTPSATSSTTASPSTATGSTSTGTYKDGSYDESATYQSPDGTETVEVKLTLAGDKVTALTVTGTPSGPDAVHYQGQFESGIKALVVGKSLDDVKVDKVAGSSLTSGGFNSAIDKIKGDAAA